MSPALFEVGRIGRPHGVRGHLLVSLLTDRVERVAPGAKLRAGEHTWLTVVGARPQGKKWIVEFEGIGTRNAAEPLVNSVLSAEPLADLDLDPDALWVHQLIGSRIVDDQGVDRGTCVTVLDNPAHAILELDTGWLVPIVFVTGTKNSDEPDGPRTVFIKPPDGLFD